MSLLLGNGVSCLNGTNFPMPKRAAAWHFVDMVRGKKNNAVVFFFCFYCYNVD